MSDTPSPPSNIVAADFAESEEARRLKELTGAHKKLYEEFFPTLSRYQEMAKRALDMQIEMFHLRFAGALPDAQTLNAPLIVTISAREMPSKLDALLAALAKDQIAVGTIVYDPKTFAFHLYGKA